MTKSNTLSLSLLYPLAVCILTAYQLTGVAAAQEAKPKVYKPKVAPVSQPQGKAPLSKAPILVAPKGVPVNPRSSDFVTPGQTVRTDITPRVMQPTKITRSKPATEIISAPSGVSPLKASTEILSAPRGEASQPKNSGEMLSTPKSTETEATKDVLTEPVNAQKQPKDSEFIDSSQRQEKAPTSEVLSEPVGSEVQPERSEFLGQKELDSKQDPKNLITGSADLPEKEQADPEATLRAPSGVTTPSKAPILSEPLGEIPPE